MALRQQVQKIQTFAGDDGETETRLVESASVVPGDELRYTIAFENQSEEVAAAEGRVVITSPVPPQVRYIANSAGGVGTTITYSADGGEHFGEPEDLMVETDDGERPAQPAEYTHIRWLIDSSLEPGEQGSVFFRARLR